MLSPCISRCLSSIATSSLKVGVVGAGQIGRAVAINLLKEGHEVLVTDVSNKNREEIQTAGGTWVDTPSLAATGSDVLITALPAPPHVRLVMEGEGTDFGGLLDVLADSNGATTWIDHTTTDPDESTRLHMLAKAKGIPSLEAPLTGGLQLLQAGMMTVLVGGDETLSNQWEPLMKCYANTVLRMGDTPAASVVKIITNQLAGVHLIAAGEAAMLAKKSGVDLRKFFDGVRYSAGNSYVFETEVPLMYNQSFDPGFEIKLHCKDLNIGDQMSKRVGQPTPMFGLSEQILYGDDCGSSHPAKLQEEDSGLSKDKLHVKGFEDWAYTVEQGSGDMGGYVVKHKNVEGFD